MASHSISSKAAGSGENHGRSRKPSSEETSIRKRSSISATKCVILKPAGYAVSTCWRSPGDSTARKRSEKPAEIPSTRRPNSSPDSSLPSNSLHSLSNHPKPYDQNAHLHLSLYRKHHRRLYPPALGRKFVLSIISILEHGWWLRRHLHRILPRPKNRLTTELKNAH
jgi:hypothetical protein